MPVLMYKIRKTQMRDFEEILGYEFNNKELIITALTHSSYANENRKDKVKYNERLEFLGDSVLGMVTAKHLFSHFPDMPEGQMSKMRAELVCEQSLETVAKELHIGDYLRLGKGEELSGGRERKSILADAVESVIAALYLDSGLELAESFINKYILSKIETGSYVIKDYKTLLQELVQKKSGQIIKYELIGESGPDHNKIFTSAMFLNDKLMGEGSGKSKKEAEQMAAKKAMEVLNADA